MAMSRSQLDAHVRRLNAAAAWTDVFGTPAPRATAGDAYAALRIAYRREMRRVHPDRFATEPGLAALANEAARLLNRWLEAAEADIGVTATRAPGAPASATVIDIDGHPLVVGEVFAEGDLADLHHGTGGPNTHHAAPRAVKVVRDLANNDLMENEAWTLARLRNGADPDGWGTFGPYLPTLEHAVILDDGRRANVFARTAPSDGWYSLADVQAAYPRGVDARTVGWMFSRMLELLSWLHRNDVVHGAILPEHVLVRPEDHGAKLVDWCYAVRRDTPLAALSSPYRRWYPPEVLERRPAGPGLDLLLAARTMIAVAGGSQLRGTCPDSYPAALADVLRGCLIPDADARYGNAFEVYERWRGALRRAFGGIRFHPFSMPSTSTST